jgi:histidyl-tRNA synthetase
MYADFDKCSELVQMLSVFEQNYFTDKTKTIKRYPYSTTNQKLLKMINTLEYIAADPVMQKLMKEEYYASLNETIWKSKVKTLTEENAVLSDTNEALSDTNAAQSNKIEELKRLLRQSGIQIPPD